MKTRIIMITIIAVMVTAGFAVGADDKAAATKASDLKTEMQKVSYIIGNNIGSNFKQSGLDNLDYDAFVKGIKDAIAGKDSPLSNKEIQEVMQAFSMKMQAKQAEIREKMMKEREELAIKNAAAGKAFLENNKKKKGVKVTDSGLQYEIIKQGTGPKLTKDDYFKAYYKGTFIDGEVFDSAIKGEDDPLEMEVSKVIPGWVEALQIMPIGSKWKLYIPGDLAYGKNGRGKMVNATLIFEIELVGKGQPPQPRTPMPRPGGPK